MSSTNSSSMSSVCAARATTDERFAFALAFFFVVFFRFAFVFVFFAVVRYDAGSALVERFAQLCRAGGGRKNGYSCFLAFALSVGYAAAISRRTSSSASAPASPRYFAGRRRSPNSANTRYVSARSALSLPAARSASMRLFAPGVSPCAATTIRAAAQLLRSLRSRTFRASSAQARTYAAPCFAPAGSVPRPTAT